MTMSDGNFAKKLSPIMEDFEEEKLKRWESDESTNVCEEFISRVIWAISIIFIVVTFPFSLCVSIRMVQEYQRAVIFRLGRVKRGGAVGPGLFFIVPCMDQIVVTDLRTISFNVPPQEILTNDSVTVTVDAVVYYKIMGPMLAVCNVKDYDKSTKLLASTTLRTILGTKSLAEILSDRETIAVDILENLDTATDPWGTGGTCGTQRCETPCSVTTSYGSRSRGCSKG